MKSIWMVALLGLVLLVPLASAGDVASSEASGQLGFGVEDDEDEGDQGLKTLAAESQEETALPIHYTIFVIALGIAAALGLTLLLFYAVIRLYGRK